MAEPKNDGGVRHAAFSTISRRSRADEVQDQLQAALERGDFKAGDRLPSERELAEAFGVSRVSVREAVRSLEVLGMVRVRQGLGSFVAPSRTEEFLGPFTRWIELHASEVMELLVVRSALDQLAAERAAENVGPAQLRSLVAADKAFARAARSASRSIADLAELDIAFHETVAHASGSELTLRLLQDLNRQLEESRRAMLAAPERRLRSIEEHAEILRAISSRDPDAARAAVSAHIRAVQSWLEVVAPVDDGSPATS